MALQKVIEDEKDRKHDLEQAVEASKQNRPKQALEEMAVKKVDDTDKEIGEKTPEEIAAEKKQEELRIKKLAAHARYMRYSRSVQSTVLSLLIMIV